MPFKRQLTSFNVAECPSETVLQINVLPSPEGGLHLRYELTGELAKFRIPTPQPPAIVDGLWKHTCFEAFIAVQGDLSYHEFNFSPSGQWAAYAFSNYRIRSDWIANQAPFISLAQTNNSLLLNANIDTADLPPNSTNKPLQLGFAAVIETNDGNCTYWALLHPVDEPDFHHRSGFTCTWTS